MNFKTQKIKDDQGMHFHGLSSMCACGFNESGESIYAACLKLLSRYYARAQRQEVNHGWK